MTRGRARRYLLTKQGYYPQVVADAGYTVFDWSTLNSGTLFQDSAKTTPASANGDVVGCWTDGVGGVDATQATTANKPGLETGSLNVLPTLSFDGGDLLATGNISISTFAVWCVFKTSIDAFVFEQSIGSGSRDGMYLYSGTGGSINVYRSPLRALKSGVTLSDSAYRVVRFEHNGTFSSLKYYANDSELATTTTLPNDVGTGIATNSLFIGARSGVSGAVNGNIAQLLIVSPYPTDASIIVNMESYINNLWNGVY